ncbi:MAG: serine hydrolase domain-containing protein [Acidobacteriota bacterium]
MKHHCTTRYFATRCNGLNRFAALIILVSFATQSAAKVHAQADLASALTMFKQTYYEGLERRGIVGSSFVLLNSGKVVDSLLYGSANLAKQQPVTERTIYHWASITKTFTGIAIMQLRDRGLLNLDDSIIKYIPELQAVHNPFGEMKNITIRHLMSHSAGFRGATWPWGGDQPWEPHEPTTWAQLAGMFPYTEILFKPGSKYSYSNPGIIFLGRVIEILTGDDYEVYVDKNIFKPLAMHQSYFDATPYHMLKDRCQSYYRKNGRLEPARFDANTGITVSNGGLNAPFEDMVKYLNFLVGVGESAVSYEGVLKRSSLEEMWKPQVTVLPGRDAGNRREAMGLCFFIEDGSEQHFIGHSGEQNGFISHFYLNPAAKSAYLIAFNTAVTSGEGNRTQDTRLFDGELKNLLFERVFPLLGR